MLLIAAIVMAGQALSPALATKPDTKPSTQPSSEPFALIERQRITETIEPNGTVIEVTELTTLIRSQLAVESESQAD